MLFVVTMFIAEMHVVHNADRLLLTLPVAPTQCKLVALTHCCTTFSFNNKSG